MEPAKTVVQVPSAKIRIAAAEDPAKSSVATAAEDAVKARVAAVEEADTSAKSRVPAPSADDVGTKSKNPPWMDELRKNQEDSKKRASFIASSSSSSSSDASTTNKAPVPTKPIGIVKSGTVASFVMNNKSSLPTGSEPVKPPAPVTVKPAVAPGAAAGGSPPVLKPASSLPAPEVCRSPEDGAKTTKPIVPVKCVKLPPPPAGGADSLQQEVSVLKQRVGDLEATVQHLQSELVHMKCLLEEERKCRLHKEAMVRI